MSEQTSISRSFACIKTCFHGGRLYEEGIHSFEGAAAPSEHFQGYVKSVATKAAEDGKRSPAKS